MWNPVDITALAVAVLGALAAGAVSVIAALRARAAVAVSATAARAAVAAHKADPLAHGGPSGWVPPPVAPDVTGLTGS